MQLATQHVLGVGCTADIYAGTSVGAIVAALAAKGYSYSQIDKLLRAYVPTIFQKPFFPRIFRAKYSDKPLNDLLKTYLGSYTKLSEVPHVLLVVPTVDTRTDTLHVWTSRGSYELEVDGQFRYSEAQGEDAPLWEVIRASASAPRYFKRATVNGVYHEDGGLKANNPSQLAYNVARSLTNEPIHVLSVTTGRKLHGMRERQMNDGVQVAGHVIDSTLDAIDRNTDYSMHHQVRDVDSYIRCESQIRLSTGEVDDVSRDNLQWMLSDGERSFWENLDKFKLHRELTK
jgi:patatin-like phospholipase/acyl hydrolase